MNAPTDRDLILRAKCGDSEAYGEIVTRHQTSVFNVCYRILHNRNDAEDLAQETFMRAYNRLNTFDIEREFAPWIRRVAANLCLNFLESQKTSTQLDDERDEDKSQSPS
ncbi:MAG TPA: sigma-70 family RNA polymerase sigma factor, partial [Anaerolineales bacterium]|nr:sigma-70 family RNA polymerase sigma factor [Anaerolineales bacterium]